VRDVPWLACLPRKRLACLPRKRLSPMYAVTNTIINGRGPGGRLVTGNDNGTPQTAPDEDDATD
jgi:hypothetical protein